ncbi:hypothetical protein [Haloglycomyces albus]|uniref:hypothetical protein n=1 Tax=Haloglycomyces albus TaxID=526067 RepID=UPI00046D9242|nr:hypothetical protein [Haloglycomyces albus]
MRKYTTKIATGLMAAGVVAVGAVAASGFSTASDELEPQTDVAAGWSWWSEDASVSNEDGGWSWWSVEPTSEEDGWSWW